MKEKIINIINNYSPELAAEEILLLFGVSNSVFCPKCGREMIKDILGEYSCWDYDCNMKN